MPPLENQTQCWQLLSCIQDWLPPKKFLGICQEDVHKSTATLEVFFVWIHAWIWICQLEKWTTQLTVHSEWILLQRKIIFIFNVQDSVMVIHGPKTHMHARTMHHFSCVFVPLFYIIFCTRGSTCTGNNLISKLP